MDIFYAIENAQTMLGYTIIEIRKEDMAQSPVLHRNRLHIGNRLALLCRLLHDGKAGIVFLAHRVGNQDGCRHGKHRQPQSPCGQNLLSMFSEIAANQRLPQNGNRRNDNHGHRTEGPNPQSPIPIKINNKNYFFMLTYF